jgi:S1-C subfamily serine protease
MARKSAQKNDVLSSLAQIEKLAKLLGGIPVWEVFPESAAAMAGVRFGDIIVSVNGTATPTFEDFLAAGEAHLSNIEFEVFRNGKLVMLTCDAPADA